jgi:hypothetical protein
MSKANVKQNLLRQLKSPRWRKDVVILWVMTQWSTLDDSRLFEGSFWSIIRVEINKRPIFLFLIGRAQFESRQEYRIFLGFSMFSLVPPDHY